MSEPSYTKQSFSSPPGRGGFQLKKISPDPLLRPVDLNTAIFIPLGISSFGLFSAVLMNLTSHLMTQAQHDSRRKSRDETLKEDQRGGDHAVAHGAASSGHGS